VNAIDRAGSAVTCSGSKPWFQVDREGDRYWTLKALRDTGGWFTVRSTYAHRFVFSGATRRRRRLRNVACRAALRATIKLNLRARPHRKARVAFVQLRTAAVVLDMTEALTEERLELPVNVVEVRGVGRPPSGEKPLHWRLLTNHPVVTAGDIDAVLAGYAHRWKIEELHRVWKSGACRIEQSQLRTAERVIKWAILAVVNAARIERLRMLSRTQPDVATDTEFTAYELAHSDS